MTISKSMSSAKEAHVAATAPADAASAAFARLAARIAAGVVAAALIVVGFVRLIPLFDAPWPLGDPAVQNLLTLIFGFLACATAWTWFVFFSSFSLAARRWMFVGVIGAIVLAFIFIRLVEFSGTMMPTFAFRFTWVAPDNKLNRVEETKKPAIDLTTTTPDDFPQFLGPDRSCWIAGPKLARDWTEQPPKLLWTQSIGAGWSAFSAVNGYAVTMEQRGPEEWVTCYEIKTGQPVWGHAIEARHENRLGGIGPRSTPTVHNGRVYALGATGVLRCLDGATGKRLWSDDLRKRYGVDQSATFLGTPLDETLVSWGRAASPLIVDDLVVVPGGGPAGEAKNLVAFNEETGRVVWESQNMKDDGTADQISYASPALATVAGRRQILIINESTASGHDPQTGELLWSFPWPGGSSSAASASNVVAIDDSHVLLTKGYGGGAELLEISASSGGDDLTATSVWKAPYVLQTKFTNIVVKDGFAYGLSEGILECVDLASGKRKWKSGRFGHGQILGVGDLLLVLSETGELNLVELSPAKFNRLTSMPALTGKTWNNLCLYGRLLLIRNAEQAACYELP
jgi:outer membrane protein assembly factor BamB